MTSFIVNEFIFKPIISGNLNLFEEDWNKPSGCYMISGNMPSSFELPVYVGGYVGKNGAFQRIMQNHLPNLKCNRHHNKPLQNYYLKYKDNPDFNLVVYDVQVVGTENIWQAEKILTDHYGLAKDGLAFNINDGGGKPPDNTGVKHTKETKLRRSEALKGRKVSQETKDKIANSLLGKKHTEETKQIISQKAKGRIPSEETKLKMSKAHSRLSEEYKKGRIHLNSKHIPPIINKYTGVVVTDNINISKFAKDNNLNTGNFAKMLKDQDERKSCGGWMLYKE